MKIILLKDVPKIGRKYDIKMFLMGTRKIFNSARSCKIATNEIVKEVEETKKGETKSKNKRKFARYGN